MLLKETYALVSPICTKRGFSPKVNLVVPSVIISMFKQMMIPQIIVFRLTMHKQTKFAYLEGRGGGNATFGT